MTKGWLSKCTRCSPCPGEVHKGEITVVPRCLDTAVVSARQSRRAVIPGELVTISRFHAAHADGQHRVVVPALEGEVSPLALLSPRRRYTSRSGGGPSHPRPFRVLRLKEEGWVDEALGRGQTRFLAIAARTYFRIPCALQDARPMKER